MMALYDYDPHHVSPNPNPDAELAFHAGDVIPVYGYMVGWGMIIMINVESMQLSDYSRVMVFTVGS